jgi:hypothetical protein
VCVYGPVRKYECVSSQIIQLIWTAFRLESTETVSGLNYLSFRHRVGT